MARFTTRSRTWGLAIARILIADDHDGTRGILRVMLERHPGWQVCGEASDGTEALAKALELKPEVIVRDWVMPGLDATELTRQVAVALPDTAIVIFSFYDMPELAAAAKAAGVHKVATKNLDCLIAAIEEVLRSPAHRLLNDDSSASPLSPDPPKDLLD